MPRRKTPPTHEVDWKQASHFHNLIHGEHETEYRLINAKGKVVHRWGDLNDVSDPTHPALVDLQRLNNDGYGVYMVINAPNPSIADKVKAGAGGAHDNDIIEATALFIDFDHEDAEGANLDAVENAEVPPSIVVQSSLPHKIHAYWLVDDLLDMQLWKRLQAQLIAHFGSDPNPKNPARIMRVPGFWHIKDDPIQTRILSAPGTIYNTAELVELFDFDPDLEPPTMPAGADLPEGYTPPRVDALLRHPFTLRQVRQVHKHDKGRHDKVIWWGQFLRENGVPLDEALTSTEPFARMLPDRSTGPVPAKEVADSITGAYAKKLGRNQPVQRRAGLENVNVAVAGGSGNGNRGDDLDEITAPTARAPITIQAGGYARVKDGKNGEVNYIQLTNWTFEPTLNLQYPDRTTGHRGVLTINTTKRRTIDLPAKAWSGRRELLTHIGGHNAAVFTNSNSDIAQIQQFLLTNHPGLSTAKGVTTYGLHHHGQQWIGLYDGTPHPELFYAGTPVDPGAYQAPTPGTAEQVDAARRTIAALPHLITPAAALAMLGYGAASAYAPRLTPHLGDRLPFLYIAGERESGKSSSIELVLALAAGHPSARLKKAQGLTPYQYDVAFSNLNNRLAALDEYRPGALDDAQLRKHHDLGSKYRGSGIAAKDHAYHLNAPLIVAGEGFTEDAATLSRGPLYFIAKEDRGETKTYLAIQSAPNWAYAHHLAETARTLPEADHKARLETAWALSRTATNKRGGPRLQFAMTFIAYGLLHLQADGLSFITNEAIERCLEVGVNQTLEDGTESKTNLETFLEQVGSAASEAKDPSMVIVPTSTYKVVIIRISGAVELVKRKYGDRAAISNPRLLRQYADKVPWVDATSVHRDRFNGVVRGVKVDLREAPERCDLGMLEALDERLRNDQR